MPRPGAHDRRDAADPPLVREADPGSESPVSADAAGIAPRLARVLAALEIWTFCHAKGRPMKVTAKH
jgi:hypothetical protein